MINKKPVTSLDIQTDFKYIDILTEWKNNRVILENIASTLYTIVLLYIPVTNCAAVWKSVN